MRQPLNFLSCDHLEKLFGIEYQALKKSGRFTIMPPRKAKILPEHERWMPNNGERYFLILGNGMIQRLQWQGTEFDHQTWNFGNCFRRRRDAEHARDAVQHLLHCHTAYGR